MMPQSWHSDQTPDHKVLGLIWTGRAKNHRSPSILGFFFTKHFFYFLSVKILSLLFPLDQGAFFLSWARIVYRDRTNVLLPEGTPFFRDTDEAMDSLGSTANPLVLRSLAPLESGSKAKYHESRCPISFSSVAVLLSSQWNRLLRTERGHSTRKKEREKEKE